MKKLTSSRNPWHIPLNPSLTITFCLLLYSYQDSVFVFGLNKQIQGVLDEAALSFKRVCSVKFLQNLDHISDSSNPFFHLSEFHEDLLLPTLLTPYKNNPGNLNDAMHSEKKSPLTGGRSKRSSEGVELDVKIPDSLLKHQAEVGKLKRFTSHCHNIFLNLDEKTSGDLQLLLEINEAHRGSINVFTNYDSPFLNSDTHFFLFNDDDGDAEKKMAALMELQVVKGLVNSDGCATQNHSK